jgi:UDP-N-acetylglucosamine 2-epimerase
VGRRKARAGTVDAAVRAAFSAASPAYVVIADEGDAAVAAGLAAVHLVVPIVRLGAGLRCGDRGIGAETNRLVLDHLAERLYTDGERAAENLRGEGLASHWVDDPAAIAGAPVDERRAAAPIPLWDGEAATRIAADLARWSQT